ncbi:hypothetical protein CPB85DRAFT_1305624 [Mucidula mucida]|nr:hypothetical protein CPB85DRAFT_1305624 [Mucidula mucida]
MTTMVDATMAEELRVAAKECNDRCLSKAAQWASELLLSIPQHKRTQEKTRINATSSTAYQADTAPYSPVAGPSQPPVSLSAALSASLKQVPSQVMLQDAELQCTEDDEITMARDWIDTRDFTRVSTLLKNCKSTKARFLSAYSRYLTIKPALGDNKAEVIDLLRIVRDVSDPWLLYLKGLFLYTLSRREEAIECAILSIAGFTWNWAAWELLSSCIIDVEELYSLQSLCPLPKTHPLMELFHIKTLNDLHAGGDRELTMCAKLLGPDYFPDNPWILALRGCILYYAHDLGASTVEFERMLARDPWRIDNIDIYSFALHVNDGASKLSRLSREYLLLAKDRPEVCCLVGNFFSLQAKHEQAIQYFNRAAQLDPTYISAWTLMGHEQIEEKNSHAAIEMYRRAIDINRDDHRAWYGLGQAYELLNMHDYALYYLQHATALNSYDVRMWQAEAQCYEELGRFREALECYRRALIPSNPHETNVHLKLAKVHAELGEDEEAIAYHRRVVEISQANGREVLQYAKSAIEVAQHQMRSPSGDLSLAREYLALVASSNSEDVEVASDLLKLLKKTMNVERVPHEVTGDIPK